MATKKHGIIKIFGMLYSPNYPILLVVKAQQQKYDMSKFIAWYWGSRVLWTDKQRDKALRKKLWRKSQLLLIACMCAILLQIAVGLALIGLWYWRHLSGMWQVGLALIMVYPVVTAHLLIVLVVLGRGYHRLRRWLSWSKLTVV